MGHGRGPGRRRRGDAGRARDQRLRGAERRVRRRGGEVRGGLEPHGAGSGIVIAPRGIDCGVGDAGDGRHGGGVHALAHGGDGCRADGDGVGLGERGVGERDAAHVGDVRRGLGQRDAERGDGGRRGSGGCEHGDGDGFVGLGLHGEWNLGVCGCRGGGRRRDAGGDDGLADRGGGERDVGGDAFGDGRGHGRGGSLLVDSGGRGRGRGCGAVRADGRRRAVVQGGEGLRGAGRYGHRRAVRGHGAGYRRGQPGRCGAGGSALRCGRRGTGAVERIGGRGCTDANLGALDTASQARRWIRRHSLRRRRSRCRLQALRGRSMRWRCRRRW